MTIRALWVITHEKGEAVKVQFSRRYPSVEFRAKTFAGAHYVSVPEDCVIAQLLLTELGLADPEKSYIAARDDCSHQQRSPALELRVGTSGVRTLWPVLIIIQSELILACLPLIEVPPDPRPPLPSLASVSLGLALLSSLQGFLCGTGGKLPELDVLISRMATLPSVLMQVCPLGTPLDTFPQSGTLPAALTPGPGGSQKQPAWKTGVHRGRALVSVALTEMVRSMQYGNQSKQDLWDVHGTVTCKCEVEGVLPNVTVTLTLPPNGSPLQDILVHPCVTSLDSNILTASSVEENDGSAFSGPYKFPFSPPLEPFRLCSYTSQVPVPPFLGSYHLKSEDNQLKLSVVLKLHESVRNSFEFCEAHFPFFNRFMVDSENTGHIAGSKQGPWRCEAGMLPSILSELIFAGVEIERLSCSLDLKILFAGFNQPFPYLSFFKNLMGNVDIKVTSGQLEVSKEKNLLIWFLGQKFPKSREVSLEGTIHFSGHLPGPSDHVCTELTAYMKLYFRVPDLTLSGCCVDQHSVQVYSSTKPRIITTRELVSSEYYIWNSTGDAPVSSGPVTL